MRAFAHSGLMRFVIPALVLAASPALAQEDDPGPFGFGAEGMMRELLREMVPNVRDLEGAMTMLGAVMDEIESYEAPEMLPNGDIIIRRKRDGDEDGGPAIPPDGELEL